MLESVGSGSEKLPPSDPTQSECQDAPAASLLFPLEESVCCQGGWVRPRCPGSSLRALPGCGAQGHTLRRQSGVMLEECVRYFSSKHVRAHTHRGGNFYPNVCVHGTTNVIS